MKSGLSALCIEMLIILDLFAYWALPIHSLAIVPSMILVHYPVPPFWRALPANLILIITFYTDHCTLY